MMEVIITVLKLVFLIKGLLHGYMEEYDKATYLISLAILSSVL